MATAKKALLVAPARSGPKPDTIYQSRGPKRLVKGKIPVELANRLAHERAAYGDMSVGLYLTGVLNAFYEAGLELSFPKAAKK